MLSSFSDIEYLASPDRDMENEADNLQTFSGDKTMENSDSHAATVGYDDQADDGILSPALLTPSPVKKARGRPRKNIRLNIIDNGGKVCKNELTKRGRGRPRKKGKLTTTSKTSVPPMETFTSNKAQTSNPTDTELSSMKMDSSMDDYPESQGNSILFYTMFSYFTTHK